MEVVEASCTLRWSHDIQRPDSSDSGKPWSDDPGCSPAGHRSSAGLSIIYKRVIQGIIGSTPPVSM